MSTISLLTSSRKEINVNSHTHLQVLHLSTSHSGGAGIAARRLHSRLLQEGINSGFLTLESQNFEANPNDFVVKRNMVARFASKFTSFINSLLYKNTYFTLISFSNLTLKKLRKLGIDQDTVLHLHNWFNLLNFRSLKNLLSAGFRIVITLHDERFYTGGCHYTLQCSNFTDTCSDCPLIPQESFKFLIVRNHRRLKELVDTYGQQLTFVAPSHWILNQAKMSSILGHAQIIHQPNFHGEFESDFKNLALDSGARQPNQFNIGVGSADSNSPLKGADFIPAIFRNLKHDEILFNLLELVQFPKNQNGYMQFWKDIDCLLVLSRADNSPNVVHEAKIVGVPVIATRVGGIPELIDPINDFLFDLDDTLIEKVSRAIIEIAEREKEKTRKLTLKSKIEDPLRALRELYNINSQDGFRS